MCGEICSNGGKTEGRGEVLLETHRNKLYVYVCMPMYACTYVVLVIYMNVITFPYCEGYTWSFQEF